MCPRLGESDVPVVDVTVKQLEVFATVGERKVVGDTFVVVQKILFNGVRAVSETQDEVFVAVVRVILHDVPEDRPVANRDHRLGDIVRIFAQAHPESATEDDHFHGSVLLVVRPQDEPVSNREITSKPSLPG